MPACRNASERTRAIADQAASLGIFARRIYGRHRAPGGLRNEPLPIVKREGSGADIKRARSLRHQASESFLDVTADFDVGDGEGQAQGCGRAFQVGSLGVRFRRIQIGHNADARGLRDELAQQLQALSAQNSGKEYHSCDIAAGPVER